MNERPILDDRETQARVENGEYNKEVIAMIEDGEGRLLRDFILDMYVIRAT